MRIEELFRKRENEARLDLTATVGDVEAILDPPLLRVDFTPPEFGVSGSTVDPLWHCPEPSPSYTLELVSRAPGPRVVSLRNVTLDSRFRPDWAEWVYLGRAVMESEGSVGAEAQDGVGPDGALKLLLLPGERRRVRLEYRVPLVPGLEPCRLLHRIAVACEGEEESRELTSHLLLTHEDSRLLRMLPGIYQEAMEELRREERFDIRQRDIPIPDIPFFERYLIGFQDAVGPIQTALARLDALFGAYSTPPCHLVWLATWVCMPLDENWSEMKRRRLVHEAVELFRWRGTKRGLSRFLEIYTGVRPIIHDQPQTGAVLGPNTAMGDPATIIGDVPPHTFTVTLPVPNPAEIDEEIVHRIIAAEKPAHTAYRLLIVRRDAASHLS